MLRAAIAARSLTNETQGPATNKTWKIAKTHSLAGGQVRSANPQDNP